MLQSVGFSPGTGKSHFVEALAHKVIDAGMRVAWFTLESLTATIGRATVDGTVAKTIARIARAELIVVDDIGMLPAGQAAGEAFYRLVDAAYERRSVAVTSNIHPSKAHLFRRTSARWRRSSTGSDPLGCGLRGQPSEIDAVGQVGQNPLGSHPEGGGDEFRVEIAYQLQ